MKRSKILVCTILCMVFAFMFTGNVRAEGSAPLNGLVREGEYTYFYIEGERQYDYFGYVDGGYRYFDAYDGAMATGWTQFVPYEDWYDWEWFYFDEEEGIAPSGCYEVDGIEYYFYHDGRLADEYYTQYVSSGTDIVKVNGDGTVAEKVEYKIGAWTNAFGEWFWFEGIENPADGLKEIGGATYYFDWGLMASDQLLWLEDGTRYFAPNGAMATGWQLVGENDYENRLSWYYFGEDGIGAQGWLSWGSDWYYLENGATRIGDHVMDYAGTEYYFNFATDGRMTAQIKMQNGWLQSGGAWYYWDAGQNEFVTDDWVLDNGCWYMFDYSGVMYSSEIADGYVFDASGRMAQNTWVYLEYEETYAWANADGKAQIGWKLIGGVWYWFDSWGRMANDTVRFYDDGQYKIHRFASSGQWLGEVITTNGWVYYDHDWRYYENGSYVTGWKLIGNAWYYFYGGGTMAKNTTVYDPNYDATYVFGPSGALANGWVNFGAEYGGNSWYLADASGVVKAGWQLVGSTWYYLEYHMYTGLWWVEDAWHLFADSGAWLGQVNPVDGWNLLNGKWYYFEDGDQKWGWVKSGTEYYYMSDGMVTDWVDTWFYTGLNGKAYFYGFNADGTLAKNRWIYTKEFGSVYCDNMGMFIVNDSDWYYY